MTGQNYITSVKRVLFDCFFFFSFVVVTFFKSETGNFLVNYFVIIIINELNVFFLKGTPK